MLYIYILYIYQTTEPSPKARRSVFEPTPLDIPSLCFAPVHPPVPSHLAGAVQPAALVPVVGGRQ